MSRPFTLVPDDILLAANDLLRQVKLDPGVVLRVEGVTWILFAGTEQLAEVVEVGTELAGLACIRVLGSGVFAVDLDGVEPSVEHAARYVRRAIATYACRVYDDETGEDLTSRARQDPTFLFD